MEITQELKVKLEKIYQSFKNDPHILKMKDIPMHRGSSCYLHSFKVAKEAIRRAIKCKRNYDLEHLLIASILHDYYLYDWRTSKTLKKKHGRKHPFIANENAKKDFDIPKEVSDIMLPHMWPLTLTYFPKSKEAKLLNYVDDVIATREFFTSKAYKQKRLDLYLKHIEKLFD